MQAFDDGPRVVRVFAPDGANFAGTRLEPVAVLGASISTSKTADRLCDASGRPGPEHPQQTSSNQGIAPRSCLQHYTAHEGHSLQFRAEFFNIFNRANFGNPATTEGGGFGTITSAKGPRIGQFALKLSF
jgi:hypothetical protein